MRTLIQAIVIILILWFLAVIMIEPARKKNLAKTKSESMIDSNKAGER